jgi:hypothetical protein
LAVDQGDACGQGHLGNCLGRGIGIEQDAEKAVEYSKLSPDYGQGFAEFLYGICLEKGIGIEQNADEVGPSYKLVDSTMLSSLNHRFRTMSFGSSLHWSIHSTTDSPAELPWVV